MSDVDLPEGCNALAARAIHAPIREIPPGPAFFVQLATNYNGRNALLQWAGPVHAPWTKQRVLARFACFRIPFGVDEASQRMVQVPLAVADEMLAAFRGGVVRDETIAALELAIREAL